MNQMTAGLENAILHYLMHSLDSAFRARQGLETWHPDGWGERFFTILNRDYSEWAHEKTAIYAVACDLLYRFEIGRNAEEIGRMLYRKPEAFLRTILMLIQHGLV